MVGVASGVAWWCGKRDVVGTLCTVLGTSLVVCTVRSILLYCTLVGDGMHRLQHCFCSPKDTLEHPLLNDSDIPVVPFQVLLHS